VSYSTTQTFTKTDVRYVTSKVKTALRLMLQFYGSPSETLIERFGLEMEALIAADYLKEVIYGFRLGANHVPGVTLKYTPASLTSQDDLPGGVTPGVNIAGATFHSFLEYNEKFFKLSLEERAKFEATLPFQRGTSERPGAGGGIWVNQKSYSSSGQGVVQSVLKIQ